MAEENIQAKKIDDKLHWVGSIDRDLRVFDIVMMSKYGSSYNSYVVEGSEATAVFETVKAKYFDDYVKRLKSVLGSLNKIKYLVANHTEPDHLGSLEKLLELAPHITVVGTRPAIEYLKEITNRDFDSMVVEHNQRLSLGDKTIRFIAAPFLHWPDSMFSYIEETGWLFTCDVFGAHYSHDDLLISKLPKEKLAEYNDSYLYYYQCIFSPFKKYVLSAYEKIKDLKITKIFTGHGAILDENPQEWIQKYVDWSTEKNDSEAKKVVIPYVTAYGYTEQIAEAIEEGIKSVDDSIIVKKFQIDVSNYHELKEQIMNEIYWADGLLFGTSTINGDALPVIWDIAISLSPVIHAGKFASAFGSYGWSGEGVGNITSRLNQLNMSVMEGLRIKFKPSEIELVKAKSFGADFARSLNAGEIVGSLVACSGLLKTDESEDIENMNPSGEMVLWRCTACDYTIMAVLPPEICPVCGAGRDFFEISNSAIEIAEQSTDKRKILILGGGASGTNAAEAARMRNKNAEITILIKESYHPYNRPAVSDLLNNKIPDTELYLREKNWFKDNNINLITNEEIISVDFDQKTVLGESNTTYYYDKLIVATGSRPAKPPIVGIDHQGVFVWNTIDDVKQIKDFIKTHNVKEVVVVGSGPLGLEHASDFNEEGLKTHIVEMSPWILNRQLDEESSELITEIIQKKGASVHTSSQLTRIHGSVVGDDFSPLTSVSIQDGSKINCQLVVLSVGVRRNLGFLDKKKINIAYGIRTNDRMKTSVKDVYACGDVVELKEYANKLLWSPALDQGNVAGANAAGDDLIFDKIKDYPLTLFAFGFELMAMGDYTQHLAVTNKHLVFFNQDVAKDEMTKFIFRDGHLMWGVGINVKNTQKLLIKAARNPGECSTNILNKLT